MRKSTQLEVDLANERASHEATAQALREEQNRHSNTKIKLYRAQDDLAERDLAELTASLPGNQADEAPSRNFPVVLDEDVDITDVADLFAELAASLSPYEQDAALAVATVILMYEEAADGVSRGTKVDINKYIAFSTQAHNLRSWLDDTIDEPADRDEFWKLAEEQYDLLMEN